MINFVLSLSRTVIQTPTAKFNSTDLEDNIKKQTRWSVLEDFTLGSVERLADALTLQDDESVSFCGTGPR